jgi:ankyrin repeat protein
MKLLSLAKTRGKLKRNRPQLDHEFEEYNSRHLDGIDDGFSVDDDTDMLHFRDLCKDVAEGDDDVWDQIRIWLSANSDERITLAVTGKVENEMTALHCVCRSDPPEDIINVMLEHGADALDMQDIYGWAPLHYACACGASYEVIMRLNDESPFSKTSVDRRGRAPIHFALSNLKAKDQLSPVVVASLVNTGAATYPDDTGMLPLHYACAYGSNDDVIKTLIQAHPDAMVSMDDQGRTPLVFCLVNCGQDYAAAAVRYMLEKNKEIVDRYEGDNVPLYTLADHAHQIKDADGMTNSAKCLECYLNTEPLPTAGLISAIQQLPIWLLEQALDLPVVHALLNQKTSQPFPTAVLMVDFYVLTLMIISFSQLIVSSIGQRSDDDPSNDAIGGIRVTPLYLGIAYFVMRELIQLIGVSSLGALSTYLTDTTNLIDILYISLLFNWTYWIHTGIGDLEVFRMGTALTLGLVWTNVLVYFKNVLIDFAIFVAGVSYVVRRLGAFMLALFIVLMAFAQIFLTVYQGTPHCTDPLPPEDLMDIRCGSDEDRHWCDYWSALIRLMSMMLGAIDENDFPDSQVAIVFLVIFFFLVVILLANVLIAIVTEAYAVVRNERAALVFWTNRLDFVAEMDAIAHAPWVRYLVRWVYGDDMEKERSGEKSTYGSKTWNNLLDIFEEEVEKLGWWSSAAWKQFFNRIFVAFIILPTWIFLGLVSAGLAWPPEIREYVFVETIASRLLRSGDDGLEEQRASEVVCIMQEVEDLSDELALQLSTDRVTVAQIHANLYELRLEVLSEIKRMKETLHREIGRLNDKN